VAVARRHPPLPWLRPLRRHAYLVKTGAGTTATLGFASSAWKCVPRDAHIGWDASTRQARLHLVVGNARFLILPDVKVANLAFAILGSAARRLQSDWVAAYGYRPVLLETFVETDRLPGRATGRQTGSTSGAHRDGASSTPISVLRIT
jgi:hypothetical protein